MKKVFCAIFGIVAITATSLAQKKETTRSRQLSKWRSLPLMPAMPTRLDLVLR